MTFERFTTSAGQVWPVEVDGDGPAVLALHGVGGGAYFFRGLASRLDFTRRVIATDLPAGLTPDGLVEPADMGAWADGLVEVVGAVAPAPIAVIGHSLGTILALELWRRRPDLIRCLVFVGGLPEVREGVRQRLSERAAAIRTSGSMEGWGPRVSPGVFGSQAARRAPEAIGMFERLLEAHHPGTYVRNLEALLAASARDVVPTVTVPCCSISGTDDNYAPPDAVQAFISALPGPCERVLFKGVGHMPFFEVPEEFAGAVGAFLNRVYAS